VTGVVLWDFDGTLAWRPGLWSGCVIELLDEHEPGHGGTVARVRELMRGAYPWNRHEQPHPHLAHADTWWDALRPALARAIAGCGVAEQRAGELAGMVRERFVDASRGWRVFPDSRPALQMTASAGWRNVILSNHVPELGTLVSELGLADLLEAVHSSALSGYEKPHPQAFRLALAAAGDPARRWMIGDNPTADVAGAEAIGVPAILVRTAAPAKLSAADALAASRLVVKDS
jgi:putative hydrolase of the HAD superfamily